MCHHIVHAVLNCIAKMCNGMTKMMSGRCNSRAHMSCCLFDAMRNRWCRLIFQTANRFQNGLLGDNKLCGIDSVTICARYNSAGQGCGCVSSYNCAGECVGFGRGFVRTKIAFGYLCENGSFNKKNMKPTTPQ